MAIVFIYPFSDNICFIITEEKKSLQYQLRRFIKTWKGFSFKSGSLCFTFSELIHFFGCIKTESFSCIKSPSTKLLFNRKKNSLRIVRQKNGEKQCLIMNMDAITGLKQEKDFIVKVVNTMSNIESFNNGMKTALIIDEIKMMAQQKVMDGKVSLSTTSNAIRLAYDEMLDICFSEDEPRPIDEEIRCFFPQLQHLSISEIGYVLNKHKKDFLTENGIKHKYQVFFEIIKKLTDI